MLKIFHDIKNPLLGNICLLENKVQYLGPDKIRLLKSDLNMVLNLVETVMYGVKMKNGQGFEEAIVEVEVTHFIDRLLNAMSKLIQVNQVNCFVSVATKFPKIINLQENKMYRVLCNLLSNSIKHSYKSNVFLKFKSLTSND